jgi:hypothetical protein
MSQFEYNAVPYNINTEYPFQNSACSLQRKTMTTGIHRQGEVHYVINLQAKLITTLSTVLFSCPTFTVTYAL